MNILFSNVLLLAIVSFIPFSPNSKVTSNSPKFKPKTHKEINSRMLKKVLSDLNLENDEKKLELCETRLIRSQTFQDYFLPSKSKAHFDNCAFQKSINYINRLTKQNDEFAEKYQVLVQKGKSRRKLDLLRRKIMFNSGKILHAVQDFYSHTNYIDLMEKHKNIEDIPILRFWEKDGQDQVIQLQASGLISGVAWWVFPKKCPKNSPTHAKLARDNEDYDLGKKKTKWINPETNQPLSGFKVALRLAEKSTYQFLLHTFNKYPMLKSYCANDKI